MVIKDFIKMVGDFIRSRENSTELIDIEDMQDRLENLPSGGDTSAEDGLLDGTLTGTYENDRIVKVRAYGFYGLTNLFKIVLKNAYHKDTIGYVFRECSSLKIAILPSWRILYSYTLGMCRNLEIADFTELSTIGSNAFSNDTNLKKLIFRKKNEMVALNNTSAFNSTPFASGGEGGYIYVPQEAIDNGYNYLTATNWSALNILGVLPLEGSPYENPNWYESEV